MRHTRLNILLLALLALASCTPTPVVRYEYIHTRDTTVIVQPPLIERNVRLEQAVDSLLHGVTIRGKDTITQVVVNTKERTAYIRVKPDTVRVPFRDTVRTVVQAPAYKEESKTDSFVNKVGVFTIGAFIGIVLLMALVLYLKFR